MSETSQNGWSASPNLKLRKLVVAGVAFEPGIRDDDDVAIVLGYVATQYHQRVEKLINPGCWGYNYRANANDPHSLSNHSSGTAIDVNAPQHPNGVPTTNTFSKAEIDTVHRILAEVDHTIRWGGDYSHTPDSMHFEVNVSKDRLHQVAQRLEDDVSAEDVWNKTIVKWAPDETPNEGDKINAAAQLNQARGYAEDAYDRIKAVESKQAQMDKKLDQILAALK